MPSRRRIPRTDLAIVIGKTSASRRVIHANVRLMCGTATERVIATVTESVSVSVIVIVIVT